MKYSYIITHGSDCEYRKRNLLAVIEWLNPFQDILEIIVVEQNTDPNIKKYLPSHVKYIFAYNPGSFNKSWGFNIGAIESTGKTLFFGDNDVILNRSDFSSFICTAEKSEFCSPYERRVIKLDDGETIKMVENLDNIKIPSGREVSPYKGIITGGLFSIQSEIYFKLNGFDEAFRGWGAEDDAFRMRLYAFKVNLKVLKYIAFHLFHPGSGGVNVSNSESYKKNRTLLFKLRDMNHFQLMKYINLNQNIGDINKYR